MIYILFFSLVAMAILAYVFERKDILSPWVITCIMYTISTFFAMVNINRWQFTLSSGTVLVILSGLVAFGLGTLLFSYLFHKESASIFRPKRLLASSEITYKEIDIPYWLILAVCGMLILIFGYLFVKTYQFSVQEGNTQGLAQMMRYARNGFIQPGKGLGRLANHMVLINECLQLIFLFFFMHNCILCRFRKKWLLYLCPVGIVVAAQILGTGRTFMIMLLSTILLFGFLMFNLRWGWNSKTTIRIIMLGCIALILFFAVFTLLGYLTGKSKVRGVWDTISLYTGLSIPSLDVYLSKPRVPSDVLGKETLYGLRTILKTLGFDIASEVRHLEFSEFANGISGNVYTNLRRYINDYGYAGMLVLQFIVGSAYSLFYNYLKSQKKVGFPLILYSMLFFPLVMQGIDELLLSSMVNTTTIYKIIYFVFFYSVIKWLSKETASMPRRRITRR